MIESDVIIVGGGPAGSSCASVLTANGLKVILLDRRTFPRDKLCAGWVTPPVLDALNIDLHGYAKENLLTPIHGFRISVLPSDCVETRYDETVSYGIRRCEFDTYLLRRCGAEVIEGCYVKNIVKRDAQWVVNQAYTAPLLIGAGGFACPVVRAIDAKCKQGELAVAAKEIEFKLSASESRNIPVQSGIPELHFCRDLKGYGWCFRKGDYLNIGIGREAKGSLGRHLADYLDYLQQTGRITAEVTRKFPGHAYLIYGHTPRKIVASGVLLIGDAAGLAYPKSGEGIRPAVESGLLAGEVVVNAKSDYSESTLHAYEQRLHEIYGNRQPGKPLIPRRLTVTAGRYLMSTRWFTRKFVLDQWFLHRRETRPVFSALSRQGPPALLP